MMNERHAVFHSSFRVHHSSFLNKRRLLMKLSRFLLVACALASAAVSLAGCSSDMNANNANANVNASASPSPAVQTLSEVERPQTVKDKMRERGEQDSASPTLKIVEPKEGAMLTGSNVKLKLDLSGDLKG